MNQNIQINKNYYIIVICLLIIYFLFSSYFLVKNIFKKAEVSKVEKIKIERNFLNSNIELKDYTNTEFKITAEWKKIIDNIRTLHKSPTLIDSEKLDLELCAWYIWTLSEKIWWNMSPYYIWMMNLKSKTPSKAWELPNYYSNYWWKILIDLWDKISLENFNNYYDKINLEDLKKFFSSSFSEEALLWDIWFLYTKTKYSNFLKNWSYNSHIVKNMWISEFEITLDKDYKNKKDLEIISEIFWCKKDIDISVLKLLENYELYLNWKKIVLYNNIFYYLDDNMWLWEMLSFNFRDKLTYKDITIAHFFDKKSNVDSLFNFVCRGEFYPINVISINKRFIEKY